MTLLIIVLALLANMLIGLFVIVVVDDDKDSLRFWICSDALPGGRVVVIQLWPLVLWFWVTKRRSK